MKVDNPEEKDQQIELLRDELQQQRGMIWLLGEIMKLQIDINSFSYIMAALTDMVMGVMGVETCCVWIYYQHIPKVYFRSVEIGGEFKELINENLPNFIAETRGTCNYSAENIKMPLLEGLKLPGSRLSIPLVDFSDDLVIGNLVVEHEEKGFFNENIITFFETLAVFITLNTQHTRMYQRIKEESKIDPLTGAFNRRYLLKRLEEVELTKSPLTIAILDTDNFKRVNDLLGHVKGDEVLQAIACAAIEYVAKYGGNLIRYGGDEFLIMIPEPLESCKEVFEGFQQSVPLLKSLEKIGFPITITMGVSSYPEITPNPKRLIQSADRALLVGKEGGKNRVVIAEKE